MSVRHALLALLSEGPKYGLQLREEFEARTGEVWPLNVGQVYTTLQRLERDGLVSSDDASQDGREKTPQNIFRITAEGQLRNCLFSTIEWDARELLRNHGSDQQLAALARDCVANKRAGHGINSEEFLKPERAMYQIGG